MMAINRTIQIHANTIQNNKAHTLPETNSEFTTEKSMVGRWNILFGGMTYFFGKMFVSKSRFSPATKKMENMILKMVGPPQKFMKKDRLPEN